MVSVDRRCVDRIELLYLAEGGVDVDVAGDLHCVQERTGFTTCVCARRAG